MSQLSNLEPLLEQLTNQAAQLDKRRGAHHQPLFDEILFHCHSNLLIPCVHETVATYETLSREERNGRLNQDRAEFLTERLLSQVSAIQRELSTQQIRKVEPKHTGPFRKSTKALYENLTKHQEWESRLQDMVREKELALEQAPYEHQPEAQQIVHSVQQRLLRCQEAKRKLEQQIAFREKNQ
ncbi:primosomal replication protein [Vibrio amylolyticus]|uniref:primosomal replication protein n=1 Tax=Vibrio amylolyticus TaxID=2847292 RepID=UPI00354CF088